MENSWVENSGGKIPVWDFSTENFTKKFRGGIFIVGKIPVGKKVGGGISIVGNVSGGKQPGWNLPGGNIPA